MSEEGPFHTFNSHREALYRLLEATVRDEPGYPDATCDDNLRSGEGEQPSAYPSPVLWYDEMRPSDIDAYHAANVRGRRYGGNSNKASSSSEDRLVGSKPTWTPTLMDPCGKCSRTQQSREKIQDSSGSGEAASSVRGGRRPAASSVRRQAGRGGALVGETETVVVPGSAGLISGNGTSDRFMRAADPTQPPPPSRSQCPHDKASSVSGETREEDGPAAASTGSSSAHDCWCSRPLETETNEHNMTMVMMSTPPATAASTTPPDPSQATQTMFLPGLPSQVLVTQQQGDAGWEYPEGDESSQKGEDAAAASENAFPSPIHPRPCVEEAALAEARAASAGGKEPSDNRGYSTRPEPPGRSKNCYSAVKNPLVAGSEARDEATSRQNDGFTLALREFVCESGPAQSSASTTGSGGDRSRPLFKYLPTAEVLPSGWSGGQSRVVAFLEKQLSQARARCPGGYAVRAFQLACHVLRQPTVCVRVRRNRGGSAATGGAAAANDGHHEVVGIAGFVWELLRANGA